MEMQSRNYEAFHVLISIQHVKSGHQTLLFFFCFVEVVTHYRVCALKVDMAGSSSSSPSMGFDFDEKLHVLAVEAVDDGLIDRKAIERLLINSEYKGMVWYENDVIPCGCVYIISFLYLFTY
jgi:hypothetical protein